MVAIDQETWRLLEYLLNHFASSDDPLRPPMCVPGVTPEREVDILTNLYEAGYIEALVILEQRNPVVVTGLTRGGQQAASS